jgi:hypothetical protein
MLTGGLSEDGAAQALGWPMARVTARMRLLALVKQAIARTVDELEVKIAERAAEKKANRGRSADEPADPVADARREEQRQLREFSERAHGVNLDLGAGLLMGRCTSIGTIGPRGVRRSMTSSASRSSGGCCTTPSSIHAIGSQGACCALRQPTTRIVALRTTDWLIPGRHAG